MHSCPWETSTVVHSSRFEEQTSVDARVKGDHRIKAHSLVVKVLAGNQKVDGSSPTTGRLLPLRKSKARISNCLDLLMSAKCTNPKVMQGTDMVTPQQKGPGNDFQVQLATWVLSILPTVQKHAVKANWRNKIIHNCGWCGLLD